MNKKLILEKIKNTDFGTGDSGSLYKALSKIIMDSIEHQWKENQDTRQKQVHYLSSEFLIGRMIFDNLMNLDILDETTEILKQKGIQIKALEDIEDAALGNGGLGRLAACFLDSAASMGIPLNGYGIRYKYGLFKQKFENGFQTELPDDWQKNGDFLSKRRDDIKKQVEFAGGKVTATAYDYPIIGYKSKRIGLLRLWQAEGENAQNISSYLYPDDSNYEGKKLRLKQEFFFSSASIQDVIDNYIKDFGMDFEGFADKNIFQLNDTHPVISILELIRILTEEYKQSFKRAKQIAEECFCYTNHTIMQEALECWDLKMLKEILPKHYKIAKKIDRLSRKEFKEKLGRDRLSEVEIISSKKINMARLAVYISKYVNGVAEIHTGIIKNELFSAFNQMYPQKIQNKTNGITQRRWLKLSNPLLSEFITENLGSEDWITNLDKLVELNKLASDKDAIQKINQIKNQNKIRLASYIKKQEGIDINTNSIFDVQIKRLHEYKRQFMNALSILYIYFGIKDGSIKDFYPTTYIFGAKAAGSYFRAKGVIKFINEIATLINNDKETNNLIKVVFVENYNVSYAEMIIPATEVSEQISLAGTEASGTGNMKMALNGAVTLGTLDGANIEIVNYAGIDNNYIFGMTKEQVEDAKLLYSRKEYLEERPKLARVVNTLIDGTFDDDGKNYFIDLYNCLVKENDKYFVIKDLESYIEAKLRISKDYKDRELFGKKTIKNIANAGYFSSDRTINQYATEIWGLKRGEK